jgi:hypothetical protein
VPALLIVNVALVSDDLSDEERTEVEQTELRPPQIVNLDEWVVPIAAVEQTREPEAQAVEIANQIGQAEVTVKRPAFCFARPPDVPREIEGVQLALDKVRRRNRSGQRFRLRRGSGC